MTANSGERVFTSWKEIASFFGKGVRTVQRWEQKFGLPISRPTAAKNVVLTTENELREWIRRSSSQLIDDNKSSVAASGDSITELAERLKRLENETARLTQLVANFSDRMAELTERAPSDGKPAMPTVVPPVAKRSSPKPTSSASK